MKLNFLCQQHRTWLQSNPAMATNTWLRSHDQAIDLADQGDVREAIAHAGSALESAQIALTGSAGVTDNAIRRYADTAALLSGLLTRYGERELARTVVCGTLGDLERLLSRGVDRRAVLDACARLLQLNGDLQPTPASMRQGPQPRVIH